MGHQKDRVLYNLLKKTILSFTLTDKIKFEIGTDEPYLFIGRHKMEKVVTYIVEEDDDLIVVDRSN